MAKRVMRSNRRTQRRRGSQLKQRKKRSKLLKRTLKRRNSFRKKNTYKRRKTNMKRGGRPIDDVGKTPDVTEQTTAATELTNPYTQLNKFVEDYNSGTYKEDDWTLMGKLAKHLSRFIERGIEIKVRRNTYMGNEKFCKIARVDETELFVYFKDEGVCQQTWKKFSKKFWRKHGISFTHLINNYKVHIWGNRTDGYYLEFSRKPKMGFFRDD